MTKWFLGIGNLDDNGFSHLAGIVWIRQYALHRHGLPPA